MKFTISTATVDGINAIVGTASKELGASKELVEQLTAMNEVTSLAHIRIECVDDQWEYEVDDTVVFMVLRIYIRIARFVVPLIKPVMNLIGEIKSDTDAIDTFLSIFTKK